MKIATHDLNLVHLANDDAVLLTSAGRKSPVGLRRVLHVINGEHYSGAERVQDLLGLRLPEFGYDVGFACVKPNRFPHERKCQQAELYELPMRYKFDMRVAKSLAQTVKFGGFDLLHAHGTRSILIARIAAYLAQVPFVYHVHSPTSNDTTHKMTNRINAWFERVCLSGVSQLICVSESLAQHMWSQGYDPKLISVVPNGVPARGELRDRNPPSKTWTLGTVALFRPRKGTEVLIEALAKLRSYGYDVKLHAVGPFETSDYEAKIKSLVRQHNVEDAIVWTGFTNNVDAEFDKMDIMVLPSLFGEGLPMVIIEAMAAGVPVIGTSVQGVPEVLRNGNGVIAEPGCAESLATAIRQIIRGDVSWSEVRQRAWKRQAERFSDRSMAEGVAAVYDQLQHGENQLGDIESQIRELEATAAHS